MPPEAGAPILPSPSNPGATDGTKPPESVTVELYSVLTCPDCSYRAREEMPTDACLFFHECAGCGVRLKPLPGDCCVFCSYGTVPCPPKQGDGLGGGCCP